MGDGRGQSDSGGQGKPRGDGTVTNPQNDNWPDLSEIKAEMVTFGDVQSLS